MDHIDAWLALIVEIWSNDNLPLPRSSHTNNIELVLQRWRNKNQAQWRHASQSSELSLNISLDFTIGYIGSVC